MTLGTSASAVPKCLPAAVAKKNIAHFSATPENVRTRSITVCLCARLWGLACVHACVGSCVSVFRGALLPDRQTPTSTSGGHHTQRGNQAHTHTQAHVHIKCVASELDVISMWRDVVFSHHIDIHICTYTMPASCRRAADELPASCWRAAGTDRDAR